jgi:hypothetical protein
MLEMQFDFDGLIEVVANHLYSEKKVFIRELIQNAHDGIRRRAQADAGRGRIDIETRPQDLEITIRDNGIGMNRDDLIGYLSNVGKSFTRLQRDSTEGLIGQARDHVVRPTPCRWRSTWTPHSGAPSARTTSTPCAPASTRSPPSMASEAIRQLHEREHSAGNIAPGAPSGPSVTHGTHGARVISADLLSIPVIYGRLRAIVSPQG